MVSQQTTWKAWIRKTFPLWWTSLYVKSAPSKTGFSSKMLLEELMSVIIIILIFVFSLSFFSFSVGFWCLILLIFFLILFIFIFLFRIKIFAFFFILKRQKRSGLQKDIPSILGTCHSKHLFHTTQISQKQAIQLFKRECFIAWSALLSLHQIDVICLV